MPFQPGNTEGAKSRKAKPFRDALNLEIAAAGEDHKALRGVAAKLLALAQEGDIQAIKEIADRMDGKVPQAHGGDDELPPIALLHRIERIIVDPKNPDSEGVPPAA